MLNEKFIENLSKFTKISKSKIQEYLTSNDLSNLFEHPETMDITQNQLENYLDCLESKKLNEFTDFEIKYEISPLATPKKDSSF